MDNPEEYYKHIHDILECDGSHFDGKKGLFEVSSIAKFRNVGGHGVGVMSCTFIIIKI